MRIAAISDIHGNLAALEAVLEDISRRRTDVTVNLGDILSGPLKPRETAERLMPLGLPTIRGNHERQLLSNDPVPMGLSDRYAADSITEVQREWVASLPVNLWLTNEIFLCHGSPTSDVVYFLEEIEHGGCHLAEGSAIEERCGGCTASLIFCGHTHIPRAVRTSLGQTIVNPGSVGIQAYEDFRPSPHKIEIGSPHARYSLVERSPTGWLVENIAVPYDWDEAASLADLNGRRDWAGALRSGFV